MTTISTHILDTTRGKPATGVEIILSVIVDQKWVEVSRGTTNQDGRIPALTPNDNILNQGRYRLKFETKKYFERDNTPTLYPYIEIIFDIDADQHYHIPLLLNPFGYSTYHGS